MSISSIAPAAVSLGRQTTLGAGLSTPVVSLEDRLIQGFADAAVTTGQDQAHIYTMLARSDITNPEVLSELQLRTAQYNIDVSLLNTLVRKGVSAAETLLRAS